MRDEENIDDEAPGQRCTSLVLELEMAQINAKKMSDFNYSDLWMIRHFNV